MLQSFIVQNINIYRIDSLMYYMSFIYWREMSMQYYRILSWAFSALLKYIELCSKAISSFFVLLFSLHLYHLFILKILLPLSVCNYAKTMSTP